MGMCVQKIRNRCNRGGGGGGEKETERDRGMLTA